MSIPRNSHFRYVDDESRVSAEQLENIERILHSPYESLLELAELVEDESVDFREREDDGLEE